MEVKFSYAFLFAILCLSSIFILDANPSLSLFYADVALIYDYSGSYYTEGILSSIELSYDTFTMNTINNYTANLDLLLHYPRVIFVNSNRNLTLDEHSTLESYLVEGGSLLVTGWDSLGDPDDPLLADIIRSSTTGDNPDEPDLYVRAPMHPIMNGPFGSFSEGYHISGLQSDNDKAEADTTRGAVTVAELADGYDKIIATETLNASTGGKVVYWNGAGENDWNCGIPDATIMFKNTIVWLYPEYEHDLTTSLEIPNYLQVGWSTILNATVYNRGLNNETNVVLQLLVNDDLVENKTIPLIENFTSYTLSHFWEPAEGIYTITAYVLPIVDEQMIVNNVIEKNISVLHHYSDVYLEPDYCLFESFPQNFEVTVRISNATNMYGYEVNIKYNPQVLNCTEVYFEPDFVFNYTASKLTIVAYRPDEVLIGASLIGLEPGFSGDGILCHLNFETIHPGSSKLEFTKLYLIRYDPFEEILGAMHTRPAANVDVSLMADDQIVSIQPRYQVESWDFNSEMKMMNFTFTISEGASNCHMVVPLDVMEDSFKIVLDDNMTQKVASITEFNGSHAFLSFDIGYSYGVHNIKVFSCVSIAKLLEFPDIIKDGIVDMRDISLVAKHFGETYP